MEGRGTVRRRGEGERTDRTYTSSLLLLDSDLRRLLVQTDAETFELGLNDLEVSEGLENVENDEDELRRGREKGRGESAPVSRALRVSSRSERRE